jgi:hypothetical protein
MKTKSFKHLVPIIGLSLLSLSSPLIAQESGRGYTVSSTQTEMNEPAGAVDDRGSDLWWLGLLGLLGLFGLRGRYAKEDTYRTTGTARA